jgi:hypothetical protein
VRNYSLRSTFHPDAKILVGLSALAANRRQAMMALVGMWKDRDDLADATTYIRRLRRGKRLKRIAS